MALAYNYAPFPGQPTGKLYAAYRPVVVQVLDDLPAFGVAQPIPVVFLDVYINSVYYKTLSATSSVNYPFGGGIFPVVYKRVWTFDLQDTLQEYLRSEPPTVIGTTAEAAPASICQFYTKVRGSSIVTGGFTAVDGPAPVQGNFDTAPVAGAGLQSLTWVATNATLQHEDLQDLTAHLAAYKHPDVNSTAIVALPLSHRPTAGGYLSCPKQYDHFPILFPWNSITGGNGSASLTLIMDWQERGGGSFFRASTTPIVIAGAPSVYNIPTGLANLQGIAWSGPVPNLNKITSYVVYLKDSTNNVVWVSGIITVDGCCDDGARLHFLNNAGGYDAVNFCERQETLVTKSGGYQKSLPLPTTSPTISLKRRDNGHQRFNVISNEKVTIRSCAYGESSQQWLKELLDSPRVYLEMTSQGEDAPDLIPVVILDGEFITRQIDNRFQYVLEVTYQPSNENIRQRG